MPHIHELIDFTVAAYIVHEGRVLMVNHPKYEMWLPIGGHIELNEDSDMALFREIEEECGLKRKDLDLGIEKPGIRNRNTKFLYAPDFLDIHRISATHQHIGMTYLIKSSSDEVRLEAGVHKAIRWLSEGDIDDPKYDLAMEKKFYVRRALEKWRVD